MWGRLNGVEGIRVARCTVERLMREMGLPGVRRGRTRTKTTITSDGARQLADLVERDFTAVGPNRLWLADLTYVKTHSGWVYVAFIIDAFSPFVVGWQTARSPRSDLPIDALETAIFNRQRTGADLVGLVHHTDRGAQYLSIRYSGRLAANDTVASVGSRGDSYDNAMTESFHGPTNGNSSTAASPGAAPTTSNSPPSKTSTGSTTDASTERSSPNDGPSPPLQPTKPPTTVKQPQPTKPSLKPPSPHQTRGDSHTTQPQRQDLRLSPDRVHGGPDAKP